MTLKHREELTHNGQTMSIPKWAKHLGISRPSLYERLHRYRARLELKEGEPTPSHIIALILAPKAKSREITLIEYKGECLTAPQWAERIGISRQAMHRRLKRLEQGKSSRDRAFSGLPADDDPDTIPLQDERD